MIHFIPAVLWAMLILGLSLVPPSTLPKVPFLEHDKVFHALFYGILSMLIYFGYRGYHKSRLGRLISADRAIWLGMSYGLLLEIMQKVYTPYRSGDLWDLAADWIGCILGVLFAVILTKLFRRHAT